MCAETVAFAANRVIYEEGQTAASMQNRMARMHGDYCTECAFNWMLPGVGPRAFDPRSPTLSSTSSHYGLSSENRNVKFSYNVVEVMNKDWAKKKFA